jgi:hypothetical protein
VSQVFSILTLPRCRSAWLATFLDYPPMVAIHEPSRRRPNLPQLRAAMEASRLPYAALVDPSMSSVFAQPWLEAFAGTPVGFVVRPPAEVEAALKRAFPSDAVAKVVEASMRGLEAIYDARGGEVPMLQAKDVGDPAKLAAWLAKLVPELPFQQGRFQQLARLRITVAGYTAEELEV